MFSGSAAGDSSALVLESSKYHDEDYTRKKNQMKATLSKSLGIFAYLLKRPMTGS